ncbi:hypothetical protein EJB05_28243, partial [Eragrostis curvula]
MAGLEEDRSIRGLAAREGDGEHGTSLRATWRNSERNSSVGDGLPAASCDSSSSSSNGGKGEVARVRIGDGDMGGNGAGAKGGRVLTPRRGEERARAPRGCPYVDGDVEQKLRRTSVREEWWRATERRSGHRRRRGGVPPTRAVRHGWLTVGECWANMAEGHLYAQELESFVSSKASSRFQLHAADAGELADEAGETGGFMMHSEDLGSHWHKGNHIPEAGKEGTSMRPIKLANRLVEAQQEKLWLW